VKFDEVVDYAVIGGGSSGSVIASRLAEACTQVSSSRRAAPTAALTS